MSFKHTAGNDTGSHKRRTSKALSLTLLSFSVLGCWSAYGQVVPGSVAPSQVERQFGEPKVSAPSDTGQPAPQIEVPQTAVSGKLAQRFTLKKVVVDDVTVYQPGAFEGLYSAKLGKDVTLAEAREIARSITTRYRTDGYVLSQAVIPNQDLKTGTLHIRMVEGFVDKIYVENDRPNSDRRHLIEGYAHKINKDRPLNTHTLERYMLLISDLPGVTARAIIRPSPSTFGAADLVIKVTNKVFEGSFTSDNRGNKFIGPYQEQLTLTENSALGLGERTTIRGINSLPIDELHFFDVQNEEQIGSEGTKLTFLYSNAYTHPGNRLSVLNIQGTSDDYSLTVSQPFIRSRAQNLTGRLTFDAHDTENDINFVTPGIRTNDRVRAFRLGGTYDTGDAFGGVDLADLSVSQGINGLDATRGDTTSSPNATPNFTKGNISLSRVQTLPYGFSVLTAGEGQYSNHPLYTSEQLTLGGVGFGQAYDTGELSGDSGLAGRVELRYGQPVGWKFLDSYQLYTYYDIGTVWLADPQGGPDEFSLASVGVGSRVNFNPNLYGYVEVGFPLTRDVASEQNADPRFFFSVTGRF